MKKSPLSYAPLSSGFMLTSILGFLISIWMIMDWSTSWGFTLALFFTLMFISAVVSMTKAEPIPEHMDELAIHRPKVIYKERDKSPHFDEVKWYEPLLIVYFVVWIYFVFRSLTYTMDKVNGLLAIVFLIVTVGLIIYFIIDAVSNDRLRRWQQLVFTVLLVFTAGLGIFIYYIYKRIKSLPGVYKKK